MVDMGRRREGAKGSEGDDKGDATIERREIEEQGGQEKEIGEQERDYGERKRKGTGDYAFGTWQD